MSLIEGVFVGLFKSPGERLVRTVFKPVKTGIRYRKFETAKWNDYRAF